MGELVVVIPKQPVRREGLAVSLVEVGMDVTYARCSGIQTTHRSSTMRRLQAGLLPEHRRKKIVLIVSLSRNLANRVLGKMLIHLK